MIPSSWLRSSYKVTVVNKAKYIETETKPTGIQPFWSFFLYKLTTGLWEGVVKGSILICKIYIGGFRNSQSDFIWAHAHIAGCQCRDQWYGIFVKCGLIF